MNKSKWKNKQSIHEEGKRTAHPRLTLIAKDSEGGDEKRANGKIWTNQNGKTIKQYVPGDLAEVNTRRQRIKSTVQSTGLVQVLEILTDFQARCFCPLHNVGSTTSDFLTLVPISDVNQATPCRRRRRRQRGGRRYLQVEEVVLQPGLSLQDLVVQQWTTGRQ